MAYGRSTANFSLVVLNYRDLKVIPVLIPSSAQAQRMPSWQATDSTSREGSPLPTKPLATLTVYADKRHLRFSEQMYAVKRHPEGDQDVLQSLLQTRTS